MKDACCTPARPPAPTVPSPPSEPIAPSPTPRASQPPVALRPIPAADFLMGNPRGDGYDADGETPVHRVRLRPFQLAATTVTNEQFNDFINATRYRTDAERHGWSFVFHLHLTAAQLARVTHRPVGSEWWCNVPGATWRHPEGPGSNIKKRWSHPVVHVSWNDAAAYCAWAQLRLPTEAEWEFAARGGLTQQTYPWGNELEPAGRHAMNVWQGTFPTQNTEADGHLGPAPAQSYKPNAYGLYQMTGNVWEWCADWFSPATYRESPEENPTGPATGERRVQRGGSYLCHASYCNRYRVDARSSNTPDSSTSNCSFRVAS